MLPADAALAGSESGNRYVDLFILEKANPS